MNLSFNIACVTDFKYCFPKTFTLKTNRGDITYNIANNITSPDGMICAYRDYKQVPKLIKEVRVLSPDLPCILATNKQDQLYQLHIKNTLYMDKLILRDMLLELTKAMIFDYDLQF